MNFLFSLLLTCIIVNADSPHGGLFESVAYLRVGAYLSEIILGWGLIRGGLNRVSRV